MVSLNRKFVWSLEDIKVYDLTQLFQLSKLRIVAKPWKVCQFNHDTLTTAIRTAHGFLLRVCLRVEFRNCIERSSVLYIHMRL